MNVDRVVSTKELERGVTHRHKTGRRVLLYGTVFTILAAAVFGLNVILAGKEHQIRPVELSLIPVKVIPLAESDFFSVRRTYTGTVKAIRASNLSFPRMGELTAVLVTEGTRVEKDKLLATLDDRGLRAKKKELIARKKAAQAVLDELIAGPREETIASARAEVSQRQAELDLEKAELQRAKKLFEDAIISRSRYDTVQFGTRAAQARLEAAKQKLVELEAGTRPEKIEAQRAVVDQLAAMLAEISVDLEDTRLKAPYAGIISKAEADEGTIVSSAAPLFRLVDDSRLEAWVGIPADKASRFAVGQEHQVRVDGQKVNSKVVAVLPELSPTTRTRTVIFSLKNPTTNPIVPFQMVRVDISQQNKAKGFWVPVTSLIQSKRGLWALYVAESDEKSSALTVSRRDVEVLHLDQQRAYVRGTIQEGELLIIAGTHRVVPGQRVKVIVDDKQPSAPALSGGD